MIKLINNDKITKEQLMAECALEWGMSIRTIKEYIKIIEVKYGVFE